MNRGAPWRSSIRWCFGLIQCLLFVVPNPWNGIPKIRIFCELGSSESHHPSKLRGSDLGKSLKILILVVLRYHESQRAVAELDPVALQPIPIPTICATNFETTSLNPYFREFASSQSQHQTKLRCPDLGESLKILILVVLRYHESRRTVAELDPVVFRADLVFALKFC